MQTTATPEIGKSKDLVTFQKKLNILISVFESTKQVRVDKSPVDGKQSEKFNEVLKNFEKLTGQNPVKAIQELEASLKSELNINSLTSSSSKFVVFQNNDFKILGDPKDVTRIESAKLLLSKLNLGNIEGYSVQLPENASKDGNVRIVGNGFDFAIFDNFQDLKKSSYDGDLFVKGSLDGKDIEVHYWENKRRGPDSINKNGLFRAKTVVDGIESFHKSDQGFLPKPLAR